MTMILASLSVAHSRFHGFPDVFVNALERLDLLEPRRGGQGPGRAFLEEGAQVLKLALHCWIIVVVPVGMIGRKASPDQGNTYVPHLLAATNSQMILRSGRSKYVSTQRKTALDLFASLRLRSSMV